MTFSKRSIFRESAVQKYLQRQEQGVLLKAVSPPAFIFLWIVLLLFAGTGVFAWLIQVPISVTGPGIIVEQAQQGENEIVAAFFFPPDQRNGLHKGQPVNIQVSSVASSLAGSIAQVETEVISPGEARQRFNLQGTLAQIVTGPSIVVLVNIGSVASAHAYEGSLCAAQVQIGSQRVLSLLPGFNLLLHG